MSYNFQLVAWKNKKWSKTGAHHPEPPSPIQTLWVNLCVYLSTFRNCGALRFARSKCYTVQYTTTQHSTTQHNTTQYNALYNMLSWELKLVWGENCSKTERYAQRLTQGHMGLRVMGSCRNWGFTAINPRAISVIINMSNHYDFHKDKIVVTLTVQWKRNFVSYPIKTRAVPIWTHLRIVLAFSYLR